MDIILDSNIYKSNYLLKGHNFEILFDYLRKTGSKIIMPKIVLEEVLSLYERDVRENIEHYQKSIDALNGKLIDFVIESEKEFNIAGIVESYKNFLYSKLDISELLDYKEGYLDEVVRRAVKRIKPTKADGKDFRDSLLWISIKDYAIDEKSPITFISSNVEDFAASDRLYLNENLQEECDESGIDLKYFRALKDFINSISVVSSIEEGKVLSYLKGTDIDKELQNYLKSNDNDHKLSSIYGSRYAKAVTSVDFEEVDILDIDNIYIYEMRDKMVINTYIDVNVGVSLEIEMVSQRGSYDDYYYDQDYYMEYDYINSRFQIAIDVVDGEFENVEIVNWEF